MHLPRISTVLLSLLLVLPLSSCQYLRDMESKNRAKRIGGPPQPQQQTNVLPPGALPPVDPNASYPPQPGNLPPLQPPPIMPAFQLLTGIPVPGQPGIVRSPYTSDPNALLNVGGLPGGTEVADPYTGKTFLVP